MTVPLDVMNDIRSMDAGGVPRAEIARRLGVSRNTVAKYADMEDMSPAAPEPAPRSRPALAGHEAWVESVLESDLGAPRKQRHTAKRVYDRLVAERGYEGSYSTVRRFVADWRRSRASGGGEGYLVLMSIRLSPIGIAVGILDQNGTGRKPHVQHRTAKDRNRDLHQIRS